MHTNRHHGLQRHQALPTKWPSAKQAAQPYVSERSTSEMLSIPRPEGEETIRSKLANWERFIRSGDLDQHHRSGGTLRI